MKRLLIVILVTTIIVPNLFSQSVSDSLDNKFGKKPKNLYVIGYTPSRFKNIFGIAIGPVGSEVLCDKPYTQSVDGIGIQLLRLMACQLDVPTMH